MQPEYGFSFLEILISLVLVSVASLGLYTITADIEVKQHNALLAEGAMHIVNDQLDHWRLINTDAPCTASHEEKIQLANITGCLINTEDTPYQLEAKTTKTFTGVTGPYAKEIEAIVSWKDNRDVSQSLIFYFTASVYRHS